LLLHDQDATSYTMWASLSCAVVGQDWATIQICSYVQLRLILLAHNLRSCALLESMYLSIP